MPRHLLTSLLLATAIQIACAAPAPAEWSRWRGPDGNSIHPQSLGLLPWPEAGLTELWKIQVGTGFSSLAISQGRVFTLGNANGQDTVFCLDAQNGASLWSYSYSCPLDPNLYQGGPSATPTVDGAQVYTLSKFGHLFCFDAVTGAIQWQRNLIDDLGLEKPEWGFAGSPLVDGNMLLLNAGGHGTALNKNSGEVIWLSNTNRGGYSSPVPFQSEGVRAVAMLSYRDVVATAVEDGRLLWSLFWRSSFDMNCPDPIPFGNQLFVTSVSRSGTLLTITDNQPSSGWTSANIKTHLSPGVVQGNFLYAFHGDAERSSQLKCLDLRTGSQLWTTNIAVGGLIGADGKLIVLAGDGRLLLIEQNPASFTLISEARPFSSRCWTLPALQEEKLFLRNAAGEVLALSLPVDAPPALSLSLVEESHSLQLTWSDPENQYTLEWTQTLDAQSTWYPVNQPPSLDNDLSTLELEPETATGFYQLRKKP